MNGTSFISVIITAHDRKDYIVKAINSVLNNVYPKDSFEILVVKNFDGGIMENIDHNIILLNLEGTIGEYMSTAIEKSRGSIICFLDDDDEFYSNKLKEVNDTFKDFPRLGYYHNSFEIINAEGETLKKRSRYKQPKRDYYIQEENKEKYLFKVGRFNGTFNTSCVCIRRSVILPFIHFLKRVPASPDGALYLAALKSNYDLLVTHKILNKYRIHGNQTIPLTKSAFMNVNQKMLEATTLFSSFSLGTKFELYANSSSFYWHVRCKFSDRNDKITWDDALQLFRYFVLTKLSSYFSLAVAVTAFKLSRISPYDLRLK